MAAEWLLLASAPSIALLVIYAPSAILVGAVVPEVLTNVDPLMAYLVTMVCGAQALACVLAISWLISATSSARVDHCSRPAHRSS
jgi:hypothetical protein